jgi:hypothetical protein
VVGPLEERDRVVVRLELGDAGRHRQRASLADGLRRQRGPEPRVELVRIPEPRLREDDRELVAADAARDVRRADDLEDAPAASASTASPERCPMRSLIALKSSRSKMIRARFGCSGARATSRTSVRK